jgi:hypothetical protein
VCCSCSSLLLLGARITTWLPLRVIRKKTKKKLLIRE